MVKKLLQNSCINIIRLFSFNIRQHCRKKKTQIKKKRSTLTRPPYIPLDARDRGFFFFKELEMEDSFFTHKITLAYSNTGKKIQAKKMSSHKVSFYGSQVITYNLFPIKISFYLCLLMVPNSTEQFTG